MSRRSAHDRNAVAHSITIRALHRLSLGGIVAAISIGCHRSAPPVAAEPAAAPRLPSVRLATAPVLSVLPDTNVAPEARVTLITGDHDMDVRQALEYIAKRGGYGLAISPTLKSRIRLNLVDVPVSEALRAVLTQANLRLATGAADIDVAWNPSLVFYQLATNIDSLSVDAMMKRYGITREIAEVIVSARKP